MEMEGVYAAVISGLILAAAAPFLPHLARYVLKKTLFIDSPDAYVSRLQNDRYYCKKCWDAGKVRRMQLATFLSWGEGDANNATGYSCPYEKTHA